MLRMAIDIGEGVWEERGLPKGKVSTAEHLALCRDILTNTYIPQAVTVFILHLNNVPSRQPRTDRTESGTIEKVLWLGLISRYMFYNF